MFSDLVDTLSGCRFDGGPNHDGVRRHRLAGRTARPENDGHTPAAVLAPVEPIPSVHGGHVRVFDGPALAENRTAPVANDGHSQHATPPPRPAAGRRSVAIHGYGRTVGQVRLNHTVRVIPDGYPIRALLENRWTYRKPVRTSPKRGVVRLALLIRHCPHVRFLLHFSTHITGIIGIGAGVWHCLPPPGIYPVIRPIYAVGGCPAMGSPRPRTSRS